jgi:hypothetical protein
MQDRRHNRDRAFAAERLTRAQHLIQERAEGENVRASVKGLTFGLLRSHGPTEKTEVVDFRIIQKIQNA